MSNKQNKINVNYFRKKKEDKEKIIALTAYDASTAKFAEEAGVELILVGDSLGMAVLGYETTVPVTIEQSLHHCKAVANSAKKAFVVGDMPFMTYQISAEQAMTNAARYLQEGGVNAVKIEGGKDMASTVERLVNAGVPVMGHIGLLPQKVLTSGGYKIAGKNADETTRLIEDAKALEAAGIFSLVLECMPAEVAKEISEAVSIPTIGIGGGVDCDGQIQVVNDILGLFTEFLPRHARRYAHLGEEIKKAFSSYVSDVSNKQFPADEESFFKK